MDLYQSDCILNNVLTVYSLNLGFFIRRPGGDVNDG